MAILPRATCSLMDLVESYSLIGVPDRSRQKNVILSDRSPACWLGSKLKAGYAGRKRGMAVVPGCFWANQAANHAEGLTNRRTLGYKATHAMHMRQCPYALVSLPGWWNW